MKLEDFEQELQIIREAGFKPIGIKWSGQYKSYKEFIFQTKEETISAMEKLDNWENEDGVLDCMWTALTELNEEDGNTIIWLNEQNNDKMQEKSLEELEQLEMSEMQIKNALTMLQGMCYGASLKAGWHTDIETGKLKERNKGEMLMLIVSEIAEAMEGERKDLNDDHIPSRKMAEVELADAVIRILDYCGRWGYDLAGALFEKLHYNSHRLDHKISERLKENGKKF